MSGVLQILPCRGLLAACPVWPSPFDLCRTVSCGCWKGKNVSYVLGLNEHNQLQHSYWGKRLYRDADLTALHSVPEWASFDLPAPPRRRNIRAGARDSTWNRV